VGKYGKKTQKRPCRVEISKKKRIKEVRRRRRRRTRRMRKEKVTLETSVLVL